MPAPSTPPRTDPLTGREILIAALVALVLAAIPLWPGLRAGGDAVTMGVDTGTVGEPWNTAIGQADGVARPRNPGLTDQGVAFYPYYRWVVSSWLGGDPPWWCPLVYCGAPGLGNAQAGVFDPQVALLVAAEAIGGRSAFDAAIDLLAWLRIAGAGLGAYLLARVLRFGTSGAALAGVGFASSGFLVLWLHHSLSHVTPFLPWILLGLEGTRGPRPGRAAVAAALTLALAVLGGHPETAFYVGAAAGLWALAILRDDRRAGAWSLLGLALGAIATAPATLPFVEYMNESAAQAVREASAERAPVRMLGLGGVALLVLGVVGMRSSVSQLPRAVRIGGLFGLMAAGAFLLDRAGLPSTAGVTFVADAFGRPGAGGWYGNGSYLEEASGWLPSVVFALAFAAVLSGTGSSRRTGLLAVAGFIALGLVLRVPGLLELKRMVPVVGLGATVRLAAVSSLFLSLLAGRALEASSRSSRRLGVALFLLVAGVTQLDSSPVPPSDPGEVGRSDALLTFVRVPQPTLAVRGNALEGWLAPGLPIDRLTVRVAPFDQRGELDLDRCIDVPGELMAAPTATAATAAAALDAPDGAQWFNVPYLQFDRLERGFWAFDVQVFSGSALEPVETRRAAVSEIVRPHGATPLSWIWIGVSLALVALGGGGAARWAVVAIAAGHGVWFAHEQNPAVPAAELFPETATERIVLREQGFHRYFGDARALWPDTGLVRGLRALDGYDGMDPASYDEFRLLAMRPGLNALLAWNARGVDLDAPAWDLLGVGLLVLRGPLEHPDWRLVAGPLPEHPEYAETWIYTARERFPRAFVASEVLTPNEVGAAGAWDPRRTVATLAEWRPDEPASPTEARVVEFGNNDVVVEVESDGDGYLVLTEQYFPGWTATVDGESRGIEKVDGIFRGVALGPGTHRVEFRYRPTHLSLGLVLCSSVLIALAGIWRVRRPVR